MKNKLKRVFRRFEFLVMPAITIKHDGHTSNYDALEAIGELMLTNYRQRTPKDTREIICKSGRRLRVTELKAPMGGALTRCRFKVETLKKA